MSYEQWLGALCLWREARGCSLEALAAIWHVILNRVSDPRKRWPRTIAEVILQKYQFSSFLQTDPNCVKFPINDGSPDWNAFIRCQSVVCSSLGTDPSNGANHYENCAGQLPLWADQDKITTVIGDMRFYKL